MKEEKTFEETFKIRNTSKLDSDIIKHYDEYYNPDLLLEHSNEIIVLQKSPIGDKKTHIGELAQFISFTKTYKTDKNFSFICFIDGDSEKSSKVDGEIEELKYYVENIFNNQLENISFIGYCKYDKSLIEIDLDDLKVKCECIYKFDGEIYNSYRSCIQIACSNLQGTISDGDNFITDVVTLIEENLKEDICFEINPENDENQYSDYPTCAIGECSICNENNKYEYYLIFIERQTLDDTLILNVDINVDENHIYSGIDDKVYGLKTEIKNVLKKGFKNIYWQFDEHNNSICKELYSRIYVLENEFRQLIIEFLMKNYGYKWEDKLVNKVLKNKISDFSNWYKNNFEEFREVYIDLFNLQVSDLITFLKSVYEVDKVKVETKDYLEKSNISSKLPEKGTDKILETIKLNLNDILSRNSVWNIYIMDVLGEDFVKIWDYFGKIRNMVAHNKPICKKLYTEFQETEQVLTEKFNALKQYINNKFDSKYKENIDIFKNKKAIEIQQYEDMYREEAGLESMPVDEEDVFEEINEKDQIIDFNNCIEEYINKFKLLANDLLEYLEDIDFEEVDEKLKKIICKEILKSSANITDEEYEQQIDILKEKIDYGLKNINYDLRLEFGNIGQIYGLWNNELEILVEGYLCIDEGNTDVLTVILKENGDEIERGTIEKTYGEYYISDCGDARPEVEDDLQVDINDLQSALETYLDDTIDSLTNYINIF